VSLGTAGKLSTSDSSVTRGHLGLSWGVAERHSRDDYVNAAMRIVLNEGFEALTAKSLGEHMGVDPSAMYRQFHNKDALLVAIFDRLANDFETDLPQACTPRSQIERQVLVVRNFFLKFPDLAGILSQADTVPPATLAAAEIILNALKELGYQGRELVVAYQAIENIVVGTSAFETSGSPHHWDIRNSRYRMMGYDAFREVAQGADSVAALANEAFNLALNSILDHIERNAPINQT
jgi:AcrR family transcriptional regulator